MTPAEAVARLADLRETHGPTLPADLAAMGAFERVRFVAWACRLVEPTGEWGAHAKALVNVRSHRRPQGGDPARAKRLRADVVEALAGQIPEGTFAYPPEIRVEVVAVAKLVLESVGLSIANEGSILLPGARQKAPVMVPVDEEASEELEAA